MACGELKINDVLRWMIPKSYTHSVWDFMVSLHVICSKTANSNIHPALPFNNDLRVIFQYICYQHKYMPRLWMVSHVLGLRSVQSSTQPTSYVICMFQQLIFRFNLINVFILYHVNISTKCFHSFFRLNCLSHTKNFVHCHILWTLPCLFLTQLHRQSDRDLSLV